MMNRRVGPTTFYHHAGARAAETILLRGFTAKGLSWGPLDRVVLTDRRQPGAGEVSLRVDLSPSIAQAVLVGELPRRAGALRSFAVRPDLLETAYISVDRDAPHDAQSPV